MSLKAPLFSVIPAETIRVAHAAFPKGNRYLQVRDTFGPLFFNPDFHHLFSHTGQPATDPARLAVIPSSSLPNGSLMFTLPTRFAVGSTGNICSPSR